MSVDFRQRTPSEYAHILWRRKWLIILPAIAVACAVGWVVWSLPNIYESTTLLTVRRPTIPNAMVPSISEEGLSIRINDINQHVQSRSSLEPLILKYGLYKDDRQRGVTMEEAVERMRNHIRIEIEDNDERNTNPAFRIAFKGRDPQTTRAVTSELASKYVNAQAEDAQGVAKQTQKFFETQAAEAKKELDDIENQRLNYMIANVSKRPSSAQMLIGTLTGLREQQKTLMTEIGRMRDMRSLLTRQMGDYQEQSSRDSTEVAEDLADPKKTPTYSALISQKASVEAELQEMRTTLTEQNPDLKKKQAQLDSIKRELENLETDATAKIERYRNNSEARANLGAKRIGYEIEKLEREISRQETVMAQGDSQIGELQARINSVPDVEVALESMNRDYQTKKGLYDQLLEKKRNADLSSTVQLNAQGESIQVVDPANLPQKPVAPKRLTLIGLGLCLGLGVGVMLALLVEVPRLLTIQSVDDASHYSGLPVLASVPDLLTPQEARSLPQRQMMWLAAGIVATIISIPLLALALKLSHVFDRFVT